MGAPVCKNRGRVKAGSLSYIPASFWPHSIPTELNESAIVLTIKQHSKSVGEHRGTIRFWPPGALAHGNDFVDLSTGRPKVVIDLSSVPKRSG